MKSSCRISIAVLTFCTCLCAQTDSCETQKEIAKSYASHIEEKDAYFRHSFLTGTFFPIIGPMAMETKALTKDVKPLDIKAQPLSASDCFSDEYARRVKIERSKEVLKGALAGTGVSALLYGTVLIIICSFIY